MANQHEGQKSLISGIRPVPFSAVLWAELQQVAQILHNVGDNVGSSGG